MTTKSKASLDAAASPAKRVAAKATVRSRATTPAAVKAAKPVARAVRKAPAKAISKALVKTESVAVLPAAVSGQKLKLVRDSFSFPAQEHAQLAELKKRALKMGREFKKSEILRAGILHLTAMSDNVLLAALSKVERVKTGRPSKKNKKK